MHKRKVHVRFGERPCETETRDRKVASARMAYSTLFADGAWVFVSGSDPGRGEPQSTVVSGLEHDDAGRNLLRYQQPPNHWQWRPDGSR